MRKLFKIISLGALIFIFVGCEKTNHKTNVNTNVDLKKQVEVAAKVPINQEVKLSHKINILTADNGVEKTQGIGPTAKEMTYHKNFYMPKTWTKFKKEDREVAYTIPNGSSGDALFNIYLLDAYDSNPLDDGEILSGKKLTRIMKLNGNKLHNITTIKIGDYDWNLGIQQNSDRNQMQYTFYRVENTGDFSDSLIVVNYVEALNAYKKNSNQMKENIGQVKAVINSLSKTKNN